MANYRLHEADIEIPDGWQDHTINAYSLGSSPRWKRGQFYHNARLVDAERECTELCRFTTG